MIGGLPFDGLCIGGLAGDEIGAQRREVLDVCRAAARRRSAAALPDGPRLAGDLLDAVDAGMDMFDSVLPGARSPATERVWVPGRRAA